MPPAAAPRAHAGTLRLLQYIEHFRRHINMVNGGQNQKSSGDSLSNAQWSNFVQEFFMPSAMMRLKVRKMQGISSEGNDSPDTKPELKSFDLPFSVLPRYHHTWCNSEVSSITMSTPGAHESVYHTSGPSNTAIRGPNGEVLPTTMTTIATHLVQAPRAMIVYTFLNGTSIRMIGHLRAALTTSLPTPPNMTPQPLKFETLEFDVENCIESIDRSSIVYKNVDKVQSG